MVKDVVFVVLFSLLTSAFSLFLEMCMQEGNILWRYREFLNNLWDKKGWYILKPLGLCIYCYSPWIAIVMLYLYGDMDIIHYPLVFGMQYVWLEALLKILGK